VLAAGAPWFVPLMFGDKWQPSVVVAWAMTINMVGGLAASPLFTLLQARNEAGFALGTFIAWTTSTWLLAGIAHAALASHHMSLMGVGAAYSLVTTIITLALLVRTGRYLERSLLPSIAPPVFAGALAMGASVLTRYLPFVGRYAQHPVILIGVPFATFVAVEVGLEGATVVSELRQLIRSARHPEGGEPSAQTSELARAIARDDGLTVQILERALAADSSAVDVGCNDGQILRHMVRIAPRGRHHAFEPIPGLARRLKKSFPRVVVHEVALSDSSGTATFHHVKNDSGYSGLQRRRYDRPDPDVETIVVRTDQLDSVLPADARVDFVKIDVEGGELGVLRGARRVLETSRPRVLFEHGRGASEFYGTTPELVYGFLVDECGYRIYTLDGWLGDAEPLSLAELRRIYDEGTVWNFIAAPA
jgi:FkbM family methyltransferase